MTFCRWKLFYKFEGAVEDENFGTSPIFGRALTQLLDGLVDGLRASGNFSKARKFADWYQLALHTHRWSLISRRAAGHPKWDALSESERRDWIAVVAAPFKLDDDTFAAIEQSGPGAHFRRG